MKVKKILAGFLSAAMIFSMIPATAFASETDDSENTSGTSDSVDAGHQHVFDGEPVLSEDGTTLIYTCTVEGCTETYVADTPTPTSEESGDTGEAGSDNETYVAKIGDEQYGTLAEAISKAESGNTVTLLADVELTEQLNITKDITIDLNSWTINDTTSAWGLVVAGKVTIKNGTIKSQSYAAVCTFNGSAVTAENLVIDTSASSSTSGVYMNGGAFTLNNNSTIKSGEAGIYILHEGTTANIYGTVQGVGSYPAVMGNGATDNGGTIINIYDGATVKAEKLAMYLPQSGTVNISGGTIEGYAGIGIKSGTLNITGGTVKGTADDASLTDANSSTNGIAYDGSAIVIDSYVGYAGEMNITISGEAVIESKYSTAIREIGNTSDQTNVVKLEIEGGTITGGTAKDAVLVREETQENVTITGGTFSSDVTQYVEEGYQYDSETGTVTGKYAAQIGGEKYETVQAAIDAVNDSTNTTITLLKDVTESITIQAGENIILDLNGKALTNTDGEHTITNNGTLTIQDTSTGEPGTVDNMTHAKAAIQNNEKAVCTILAGTFTRSKENGQSGTDNGGNSFYTINNYGKMTFGSEGEENNITVTANGHYSSLVHNGWQNSSDAQGKEAKMTICGGTFTGGINTIKNDESGYLTIYGGTFNNVTQFALQNWNVAEISGGTFESDTMAAVYNGADASTSVGKLTITDGTFTAPSTQYVIFNATTTGAAVSITGGTYSSQYYTNENSEPNYVPVRNEDGTYGVQLDNSVASVTDSAGNVTKYATLAEAINELQAGGTLTLLADIANDASNSAVINIVLPADAILEGNGHTLEGDIKVTVNAAGGTIQNVNFKNIHNSTGKLSAVYGSSLSGKLTVTSCSFHNCDWDALQITPVAGADITITGNTFSTDNTDGIYQVRYVHIQSANNVDFSATVTKNVMYDTIRGVNGAGLKCGALEIYYFTDAEKIKVNENYIEYPDLNCILMNSGTNVGEMAYPLYEDDELTTLGSAPVAAIKTAYEGDYYATLQDAIEAAKSGYTITLLADATESIIIPADKNITLNLNGHTLTNEEGKDTITVAQGGTLTVTGSGTVDNTSTSYAAVYNNGTCTLSGGTYTRTAGTWYTICNHGEMTINEGVTVTVDATVDKTSSMVENGYYSYFGTNARNSYDADTNAARPTLTINGGTFTGGLNTIKNDDGGILKIADGEFTCSTSKQAAIYNVGVADISGGTFTSTVSSGYAIYNYNNPFTIGEESVSTATTVSNGSFIGKINVATGTTLTVSGGTFTAALKDAWCAEGYVPTTTEVEDRTLYTVGEGTEVVSVIHTKENDVEEITNYISLARAVAAAESGDTIKLLADVAVAAGDDVKISGKALTLDLAGHSITRMEGVITPAYLIYLTGAETELTVTNSSEIGSINGGDNPAAEAIYVGSKSTVTVQNGTVQGKTHGIYVYTNGTLNVQGGTVSGSTSGIYIASKTADVTVSGGKVEGDSYGVYDLYGKLTVKENADISGGTYGILAGYIPTSTTNVTSVSSIAINGGSVTGGTSGVCIGKVAANSTLTVTGGTIKGTDDTMSYGIYAASAKATEITITGGEISGTTYGVYENAPIAPTLTISAGESTVPYIRATGEDSEALYSVNCTGYVSGGSFSTKVPEDYCAASYLPTEADETTGLYTVEKAKATVYGATLSLDGTIGVNFYVDMSGVEEAEWTSYSMHFTVNGEEKEAAFDSTAYRVFSEKAYYRFTCPVAAKQMTDSITARIYNGDTAVSGTYTYSVKRYCDNAITNSNDETLVSLLKAMLNYGGYAQTYFAYNTDNLANSGLLEDTNPVANVSADDLADYQNTSTNELPTGITKIAATLILESSTVIRFYIQGSTDGYTFAVNGTEYEPKINDNRNVAADYYIEVPNITVRQLGTMYKLTISSSEGQVYEEPYSALTYAYNVLMKNDSTENLQNVVKAMYLYYDAATAYNSWVEN